MHLFWDNVLETLLFATLLLVCPLLSLLPQLHTQLSLSLEHMPQPIFLLLLLFYLFYLRLALFPLLHCAFSTLNDALLVALFGFVIDQSGIDFGFGYFDLHDLFKAIEFVSGFVLFVVSTATGAHAAAQHWLLVAYFPVHLIEGGFDFQSHDSIVPGLLVIGWDEAVIDFLFVFEAGVAGLHWVFQFVFAFTERKVSFHVGHALGSWGERILSSFFLAWAQVGLYAQFSGFDLIAAADDFLGFLESA